MLVSTRFSILSILGILRLLSLEENKSVASALVILSQTRNSNRETKHVNATALDDWSRGHDSALKNLIMRRLDDKVDTEFEKTDLRLNNVDRAVGTLDDGVHLKLEKLSNNMDDVARRLAAMEKKVTPEEDATTADKPKWYVRLLKYSLIFFSTIETCSG